MTRARQQARYRSKIALIFFVLLAINIVLKITGISTLDTESAINATQALGMKITYFAVPLLFLLLGLLFAKLSKSKSREARNIELGGALW